MNNDLIPKKSWWQKNWRWFLPLGVIAMICVYIAISLLCVMTKEPETSTGFDTAKWQTKKGFDYPFREVMLEELMNSDTLKRLKKEAILSLLGEPQKMDSSYLFYRIVQERVGFFPLHTKTLVIKLSNDTSANKVIIHK